eukprot:5456135-Amphidinium_carterae.1
MPGEWLFVATPAGSKMRARRPLRRPCQAAPLWKQLISAETGECAFERHRKRRAARRFNEGTTERSAEVNVSTDESDAPPSLLVLPIGCRHEARKGPKFCFL